MSLSNPMDDTEVADSSSFDVNASPEPSALEEERALGWGTVYTPNGAQSLGSVERAQSTKWTGEDEVSYLERVKVKATAMATKIIEGAKVEAERVKEEARNQGYESGIAEANDELEAFRSSMADSVSAVLSSIEGQCSHIFSQWKKEIVEVAKISVEKMTCLALSEDRAKVLESLLDGAITALERSRTLTIHVHPDDEPVLNDIISVTKEKYPDIISWRVKSDSSITPGGMVIESDSSLASGLVESRQLAVNNILEHLVLPDKIL